MSRHNASPRPELSLWRDIKAFILNDAWMGPPPIINCPICRDREIIFPNLHPKSLVDSIPEDERERFCLLPCGHVMGDKCLASLQEMHANMGLTNHGYVTPLRCPVCQFTLKFAMCGHDIDTIRLDWEFHAETVEDGKRSLDLTTSAALLKHLASTAFPPTSTETHGNAFAHACAVPGGPYQLICGTCFNKFSCGAFTDEKLHEGYDGWFGHLPGADKVLEEHSPMAIYLYTESRARGIPWLACDASENSPGFYWL